MLYLLEVTFYSGAVMTFCADEVDIRRFRRWYPKRKIDPRTLYSHKGEFTDGYHIDMSEVVAYKIVNEG